MTAFARRRVGGGDKAKQRALVWEALDPLSAKGVDMIVAQVYRIGNVEAPTTVEVTGNDLLVSDCVVW